MLIAAAAQAAAPKTPAAPPLMPSPVTPSPLTLVASAVPPASYAAAAAAPPLLLQRPSSDVIAFLCGITPPLTCLEAAVAAAPSSGLSMQNLRELRTFKYPSHASACLDRVVAALRIDHTGDQVRILAALDKLA